MLKRILLTVALVLPVAVYLFLQGFGSNVYELPRLYQMEIPKTLSNTCGNIELPYKLNLEKYGVSSNYHKVIDIRVDGEINSFLENEFKRVNNYFDEKRFDRIVVSDSDSKLPVNEGIRIVDLTSFINCDLLHVANKSFMVLVDKEGYIRSYYDKNDRSDFDRMIVELEILKVFK
jgi:hypothetical protein